VENRKTRLEWVKKVAEKATIPFAVGGGIRNLEDMEDLFSLGVNKVSINTAAVRNPRLITDAATEILLTSKDADGTKKGYDLEMTKAVAEAVKIPVTASGGAGTLEHLYEAVAEAKASAVLAASIFHFGEISIPEAKKYLKQKGIPVRI
jgi:cyclase